MNWQAFERKNKTGEDTWSSKNYIVMAVILLLAILLQFGTGTSVMGTMHHTNEYGLADNPFGFYFVIFIQVLCLFWFLIKARIKYRNSKRYLKGRQKSL